MLKKRIFITGAAGFIGFHMAQHLYKSGHSILGFDNFNNYYDPKLKRDRADELKKIGIIIKEGNLENFSQLQKEIEEHRSTHILHLAAQAGVRYSLENPHAYLKSNIDGFLNILEICRLYPHIPLVYASSSSVYGLNSIIPFSENDQTDNQASLYGVTKKSNELMAQTYHHLFKISVTGLRYFTVYGPWGRPDMAYFSFTRAILNGEPIQIYNHGEMKRDFTYIDDIVLGTTAALERSEGCALYNLGNHQPEELNSLISLLEKELGQKAKKVFLPMQLGDVVSTYANIDKSNADLGFFPRVSLQEGIANFVKWYKSYT